jgi:hypothetical protein
MDLLQLVFGFVNAPLFATFLLGMFWKRGTGHGAFSGLVTGTVAAALTWCLTVAEGKGGILGTCTLPLRHGPEFLDRHRGLHQLLPGDAGGQPAGKLVLRSKQMPGTVEMDIASVLDAKPQKHWSDYVIGVAREIASLGLSIAPATLEIDATVPTGSGLSSSAALEVATAYALLAGRPLEKLEIAKLCQRAERNFVGMPCGIMDQYISVFGVAHMPFCSTAAN